MVKKLLNKLLENSPYLKKIKKNRENKIRYKRSINKLYENHHKSIGNKKFGELIKDGGDYWLHAFKRLLSDNPRFIDLVNEFYSANLKLIKTLTISQNDIVMVCIAKNDLMKLQNSIEYHRKIGIRQFVVVDNDSNDGSLEWLSTQNDTVVFSCKDKYTTLRREAWVNRILAYVGLDNWILVLDSDELFTYPGVEEKGIDYVVEACQKHNVTRTRALMIDMYAEDSFYESSEDNDYLNQCIYFDVNTYADEESKFCNAFNGGPRQRVFGIKPWLIKHPLFKFEKYDIQTSSHYLYPFWKNINTSLCVGLLHYKFLPSDMNKYEEIVKNRSFHNGSEEYATYLNKINNGKLKFVYNESAKYENSLSLLKLKQLSKLN